MSTPHRVKFRLTEYTSLINLDKPDSKMCSDGVPENVNAVDFLEKFLKKMDGRVGSLPINCQKTNTRLQPRFLQYFEGGVFVSGIVGVVRDPSFPYNGEEYDVTVEIRSRFDEREKPWFLCTMLQMCGTLDTSAFDVPQSEESFFDFLLVFLFRSQLLNALQKGWFRTYVRRESNDSRMRGSLDVQRHIRLNGGQDNGKIACRYRERTEENALNRLILCAWEYLHLRFPHMMEGMEQHPEGIRLQKAMQELKMTFSGRTLHPRACIAENLRPILHPYFVEYEALRETCLMILRDEGIDFFSGKGDDVQSVLFYLPDLWEIYLEKAFCEVLPEGYTLKTQEEKTYLDGKKARPDFVVTSDTKTLLVADAKCKQSYKDEDYNKLIRDMVVFGAARGALIRPDQGTAAFEVLDVCEKNRYAPMTISELSIPVPPNDDLSLEEWQEVLKNRTKQLLSRLL